MKNKQTTFAIARKILPELLLLAAAILLIGFVLSVPPAFAESTVLTEEETRLWDSYTHGDIIRLHVLSDDDSENAQHIKLAVRNAILDAFGEQLKGAGELSSDAVYELLSSHVADMRVVAERCAQQNGFDGSVTATIGLLELPAKAYGSITLPAGKYRALRVTIGSGKGQNWWCVLFPQLCLAVASEEPWQTPVKKQSSQEKSLEGVIWDTEHILRFWTALPV